MVRRLSDCGRVATFFDACGRLSPLGKANWPISKSRASRKHEADRDPHTEC